MQTHHRPFIYESSDFKSMCALLIHDNSVKKEQFVWHVARLMDWKYNLGNPRRRYPGNYANAAHLWFNYFDELVGFVISEEFNDQFTIIVLDTFNYLYPEMLEWANSTWGSQHAYLTTCVVSTNIMQISALEKAGYGKTEEIEMTRSFDTCLYRDHPYPSAPLRFESMAENGNYENQRLLRLSAWHHDDEKYDEEEDRAICAYIRTSPIYNARFDFVLVDQTGAHVSGCEAFIDRVNGTAEIERVCTHPDHYNKGYSQMALKSCMRVLHENAIPVAFLSGGYDKTIHLYGKLGHAKEVTRLFYKLKTDR